MCFPHRGILLSREKGGKTDAGGCAVDDPKAVRPVEKAGVNGHGQTEGSRSHEVSGTGEAAQTESQLLSARGWGRG